MWHELTWYLKDYISDKIIEECITARQYSSFVFLLKGLGSLKSCRLQLASSRMAFRFYLLWLLSSFRLCRERNCFQRLGLDLHFGLLPSPLTCPNDCLQSLHGILSRFTIDWLLYMLSPRCILWCLALGSMSSEMSIFLGCDSVMWCRRQDSEFMSPLYADCVGTREPRASKPD